MPKMVPAYDKDNDRLIDIPEDEVAAFASDGWIVGAHAEDVANRKGWKGAAAAAALGTAHGLTLGLSDAPVKFLGDHFGGLLHAAGISADDLSSPERTNRALDQLRHEHWAANLSGELAGSVAPFMFTGGLGEAAVLGKGAMAANALAKARGVMTAAEAAEEARLIALAPRAAKAAMAARVATAAASGGVQAAADAHRYGTPLDGEQMLQSIGLGGMYGLVGEGLAIALPKVVTGAQRYVKRALDKASLDESAFTGVRGSEIGFEDQHPNLEKGVKELYTAQLPNPKVLQDIRLARKYATKSDGPIDTHAQALEFLEGKGRRDAAEGLRKYHAGKHEFNTPIKSKELPGVYTLDEIADFVARTNVAKTKAQAAADEAMRADIMKNTALTPDQWDGWIQTIADKLGDHHEAVQGAVAEQANTRDFAQQIKTHLDDTYHARNQDFQAAAKEQGRVNYIDELGRIAQEGADERAAFKPPNVTGQPPEAPAPKDVPPLYEARPFEGQAPGDEPVRPTRRPLEYPELDPQAPPAAAPEGAAEPPQPDVPPEAPAASTEAPGPVLEGPPPMPPGAAAPTPDVGPPPAAPTAEAPKVTYEMHPGGEAELKGPALRAMQKKLRAMEKQEYVTRAEQRGRRKVEKNNRSLAKDGNRHVEEALAKGTAFEAGTDEANAALAANTHRSIANKKRGKTYVIPHLPEEDTIVKQGSTKNIPDDASMKIKFGPTVTAKVGKTAAEDIAEVAGARAEPTAEPVAEEAKPAEEAPPTKKTRKSKKQEAERAEAEAAKKAAEESDRAAEAERAAEEQKEAEEAARVAKEKADKAAAKEAEKKRRMDAAQAREKRAKTREQNQAEQQKWREAKRDYDDAVRDHQKARRAHEAAEADKVRVSKDAAKAVEAENMARMKEHARANAIYNAEIASKLKAYQDTMSTHDKDIIKKMRAVRQEKLGSLEDPTLTEIEAMATQGRGPLYGLPHVEGLLELGPYQHDFMEHIEKHPDMPQDFRPRAFDPQNFMEPVEPKNIPDVERPFVRSHKEYTMRRPHFVTAGIKAHYTSLVPYVGHWAAAAYTAAAAKHILGRYALNAAFKNEAAIQNMTKGIMGYVGKNVVNKGVRQLMLARSGSMGSRAYRGSLEDIDKQYADAAQAIQTLQGNPQMAAQGVHDTLRPIADGQQPLLDATATAAGQSINYLGNLIPKPIGPSGALDNPLKTIPRSQKVNFMRAYQGVNDPFSALANPTAAGVAAVQAAHPATLEQVRQRILHDLTDPKMAEKVRRNPDLARRLSLILGTPLRRADTPAAIASAQQTAQSQGQTPPPPGAPGMAKPRQSDIVNLTGPGAKSFVGSVATPQQSDQLMDLGAN